MAGAHRRTGARNKGTGKKGGVKAGGRLRTWLDKAAIWRRTFEFRLGWPGIGAIAVVCLCIFLWLFLLGIWAGQKILAPGGDEGQGARTAVVKKTAKVVAIVPESRKEAVVAPRATDVARAEQELYTIQVGAFGEAGNARQEIAFWREHGQDVFLAPPQGRASGLTLVCVGRFADRGAATLSAARLREQTGRDLLVITLARDRVEAR